MRMRNSIIQLCKKSMWIHINVEQDIFKPWYEYEEMLSLTYPWGLLEEGQEIPCQWIGPSTEPQHKQWSSVTLAEWVMILSQSQSSTAIDVYFSCTPWDGLFRASSSRVSWGRTLHTKLETRTPYRFVLDDIQLSYPRCLLISGPTRRCRTSHHY